MQGRRHRETIPTKRPTSAAVAWIGASEAVVARMAECGEVELHEIHRDPAQRGCLSTYLAAVVDEIGEAGRVVVLGPDDLRVDLEREFVAIGHHPDRILDVAPHGPIDRALVLEKLHALTA